MKPLRPVTRCSLFCMLTAILSLTACALVSETDQKTLPREEIAWNSAFTSNGERIYFTATSDSGSPIISQGIHDTSGKSTQGPIACVACHAPGGKGGKQKVNIGAGSMRVMDARDIRWSVLKERYTEETFRRAVTRCISPEGKPFQPEMPRYTMSDQDLADVLLFLKQLP